MSTAIGLAFSTFDFKLKIMKIGIKFCMLVCILYANKINAQQNIPKNVHSLVYTFQKNNVIINGISVGLWSHSDEPRNTTSNGLRLEIPGIGILAPIMPRSPISESDSAHYYKSIEPISEKINGVNLSLTGTVCNCSVNGITVGGMGQVIYKVNGISAAGLNIVEVHGGVQMAIFSNDTYILKGLQISFYGNSTYYLKGVQAGFLNIGENTKGLQIGIFNKSKITKGIQIGLWNVNEKRRMPFINWNFK
jgi:hypothetical protein